MWTPFAWWATLGALLVSAAAYWAALQATGAYGDLLRSVFDLHRFALYEQAHWPLPPAPAGEETHGEAFSAYLFRGAVSGDVRFTHNGEEQD